MEVPEKKPENLVDIDIAVKQEHDDMDDEELLEYYADLEVKKEDLSEIGDAVKSELYSDDEIKQEMVIGPEVLQEPMPAAVISDATMSTSTKSVIEDLLEKPFSMRPLGEKLLIVENGRPCPRLSRLKSVHRDSKKEYTRKFKESQYTLYPWLAGCEKQVKLFCWPCLLFSQVNSAWNSRGLENLNTLQTLQKKHKQKVSHLRCVLKLACFAQNRVNEPISTQLSMLNSQHNLQVKKNREVLKRLIDVTCFLAKQELPFRGQDESASSLNLGNYVELLNLLKLYDPALAEHLQTATVFKGTSMTIQNDLIKAVSHVLRSHIYKQLELSEFVAIMLDDPSDIEMKSRYSVVFRYCLKGKIHETFSGFIDMTDVRSTNDWFTLVKAILEKCNIVQKLVSLSYDTAPVSGGQLNSLQTKIRDLCPNAHFVHCYAHILNLVFFKGLDNIRECKFFFSTLSGISTFAAYSSKGNHTLKEYLTQKFPSMATGWCFSSGWVNVVHTCRYTIVEYFDSIHKGDDSVWESKDRMAAAGYSKFLNSFKTIFLLKIFSKLFTESDLLFKQLQNENIDIVFCVNQIDKFDSFLNVQRKGGFSEVWQSQTVSAHVQMNNERAANYQFDSNNETKYKKLFYEIINNLIIQVSQRFSSFEKLIYFDLLNYKHFGKYTNKTEFPEDILWKLTEEYPDIFEYSQLKSELMVFYASGEDITRHMAERLMETEGTARVNAKYITPYDVLQYIEHKGVATSFEQVYKLAKLICTIPATVATMERSSCALRRIKTYLRNTHGQKNPNTLALLAIEKAMLVELQNSDNFYDQVIEAFLSFDQREDFMYK